MKQLIKILLPLALLSIAFSCDISSPYIDAIMVKVDNDRADEGGVAEVSNFSARAKTFDSAGTNLGSIEVSWNTPQATGSQTEASEILVRVDSGSNPADITSGTEVYRGDTSTTSVTFGSASLGTSYHFGIWTKDEAGNLSNAKYDTASIQSTTLNILVDGYVDGYLGTKDFNSTSLFVGINIGSGGSGPVLTALRFNDLTVSNVIQADLKLYLINANSVGQVEVGMINQDWSVSNSVADFLAMANTITSIGVFSHTAGTYNSWDVTSEIVSRGNVNYGFGIAGSGSYTNTANYASRLTANPPLLEIYYGSD